ncbi:hypothetical protein M0Q50_09665 [bacterium]|jgi:hypothetical protein|nr:hypothetical protein [bacterium]
MKEEIIISMINLYEHRIKINNENLEYSNVNIKYKSVILHENEIYNMCILRLKQRLIKIKK